MSVTRQFPDEWGLVSVHFKDNITDGKMIRDCEYKYVKLALEDGVYYITSPKGSVTCIPFDCVRVLTFYTPNVHCNIDDSTYNHKVVFDFSEELKEVENG